METVNEKTVAVITVLFREEDGGLVNPSAASYELTDLNTGTVLTTSTSISPIGGVYDIIIAASKNAIIDNSRAYETKVITVAWTYGTGTAYAEYRYRVKNLSKVT
jgi:hypothetical protein